jgi:hypothetical protein
MIPCRISKDFALYLKQQGAYSNYIANIKKRGYTSAEMRFFGSCGERYYWKNIYNGYFEFLLKRYGNPSTVLN